MARQIPIKGCERPSFPEIEKAAERLKAITEEHDAVKAKKDAAQDALIAAMKKHGVTSYRDDDAVPPLLITLSAGPDKVKVKEVARRPEVTPESKAAEADADEILRKSGSPDLVKPELAGPATRHRKAKTRSAKEVGAT